MGCWRVERGGGDGGRGAGWGGDVRGWAWEWGKGAIVESVQIYKKWEVFYPSS